MTVQLHLLDTEPQWKIPEATKEIGRRGLAEAREVLARIPRRSDLDDDASGHGSGSDHDHDHDHRRHPAAA